MSLSDIFDPGGKDRDQAARLADAGIISFTKAGGVGGIGGKFQHSRRGGYTGTHLGALQKAYNLYNTAGQQFLSQGLAGLPPELQASGEAAADRLGGDIDVQRLANQSDFNQLGGVFRSAAQQAQADPFDLGREISNRLASLSERRNNRLVSKKFSNLFSKGQLGASAGVAKAYELENSLMEERLQQDLAGLDFGQRSIQDAFARAIGASGQREAIGARQFGEELALSQYGDQRALGAFGVNRDLFSDFLRNQQTSVNLGNQAVQQQAALTMLPLQYLQAAMGMTQAASNSRFAAAGINQGNAQLARSPFLEGINALGAFVGNVKPEGI